MTRRQLISSQLGFGATGAVFETRSTTTEGRSILVAEADRLRLIGHPNVVRLVEFQDADETVLAMEPAPGRSLDELHPLPPERLLRVLASLRRIMEEVHALGWSHGRLRPEHVILGSDDSITICSWSDARRDDHDQRAADLAAIGSMFLELGGNDVRVSRRGARDIQRQLASLSDPPAQPSHRSQRQGPTRVGQRRIRAGCAGSHELSAAELMATAAGCTAAVLLMSATVGHPGVPDLSSFSHEPLGAFVSLVAWGVYLLATWTGLLALLAAGALAVGRGDISRLVTSLTPVRRTGVLALVASSGMFAGLGPTGPPEPSGVAAGVPSEEPHSVETQRTPPILGDRIDDAHTTSVAIPATLAPMADGSPSTLVDPPTAHWTVRPGDHFWSIAEELTRSDDERVVGDYWARLIEMNRPHLLNPDDIDLLVPGQVLLLPDR